MTQPEAKKQATSLNKMIATKGLVATVHVHFGNYYIIVLPKVEQLPEKFTSSINLN